MSRNTPTTCLFAVMVAASISLLPLQAYATQTGADSLLGYWKFDETSGTTAVDSSGDARTGTHQGSPTISVDVPSGTDFPNTRSLSFDGVDDYVQMSYSPNLTSGSSFTWSLWFKTGVNQNGRGLFSARDSGKTGSPLAEIYLVSGKVQALFRGANGTRKDLEYTVTYADSAWHHIAVVINNGNGSLYFDGVERSTITGLDMNIDLSGVYIPIGASNYEDTLQRFFTGNIDDFRIYNRALAPWEVTQLASGNHVQAFWKGKSGTGLEKRQNWSGSYVPDPYSRLVIRATATGSLTLTGAIKAAGLTVNTGALIHLNGTGITINDAGTFTNYGTFALKNTETLSGVTINTGNGTVMITGTGDMSGFKTGSSYNNLILNDGLISYLKFDETSGTRAADSSGYGNSGTLVNDPTISTTVAPVRFSNTRSMSFDGVNDYIQAPQTSFPVGSQPRTLSAWIRTHTDTSSTKVPVAYGTCTDSSTFGFYLTAAETFHFWGCSGGDINTNRTLAVNTWYHVAATYDGSRVLVYLNGEQVANAAKSLTTGTDAFFIGNDGTLDAANYAFPGNVDDVRVYNRVLLPGEIAALVAGNQPSPARGAIQLAENTDINGDFTLNGTTLFSSGKTLTVGGSWINNGSIFHANDWIVRMDGDASTIRIQSAGQPFNDLHLEGGGTYTLSDRLTVNGALNLTDGTLDVDSTGNYPIHVNVLSQTDGVLVPRDGTVTLVQPTDQVLQYTGTLNDLIIEDPTERGLVGYWKFDEGTNTGAILDSSGYGNAGIRHGTGAVWTGATLPSATIFNNPFVMTFNGFNDVVEAPQSSAFELQAFTIGAWMELSPTAGDRNAIVTYGKGTELGGGINEESVGFIYHQTANILRLRLENAAGTAFIDLQSTPRTSLAGNLSHVAATWDGSTATLYQDGVVIGTATTAGTINYSSDSLTKLRIGNWFGNNERWFNGLLDDVRIYNRSLSAGEVHNLYSGFYADGDTSTTLVTLDGTIDLSTISIVSGIFDLTAGVPTVEVSGDWNNYAGSGGLLAGTSTVTFNGPGTQNIRGSTVFSTLEITGTSARTVNFGSGTTQWVGTNLLLQGASSNLLALAPLSAGYAWNLDLADSATQTIDFVSPSYSDASNGLELLADDGTSVDGGNNVHWLFPVSSSSSSSSSVSAAEGSGGGNRGHGTNAARAIASIEERYRRALLVNDEPQQKTVPTPQTQPTEDLPDSIGTYGISTRRNRIVLTTADVQIVYRDVASDMWYSPYVASVIESNIARGYRNEGGKLTGEFGVEKSITYAEILKMTLHAAKKSTIKAAPPRNKSAQGDWSSAYVGIAEELNLSVINPDVNVHTPITRAEVVQLIMETMGITIGKTPSSFKDVPATHPHSYAIAAAAFFGLIEGDTDANGVLLNTFRPDVHINRAEAAKLIALAKELQKLGAVAPAAFGGTPMGSSASSIASVSSAVSSAMLQQSARAVVISPQLNVRIDARADSDQLRTLYHGAIIEILWSQPNGWSRIRDAHGREGFAMTQFLVIEE